MKEGVGVLAGAPTLCGVIAPVRTPVLASFWPVLALRTTVATRIRAANLLESVQRSDKVHCGWCESTIARSGRDREYVLHTTRRQNTFVVGVCCDDDYVNLQPLC